MSWRIRRLQPPGLRDDVQKSLPWVQGAVVAVLLAAVLAPLMFALILTLTGGAATSQESRYHLNLKNSTRYDAPSSKEIAAQATDATFATDDDNPIAVSFDDWRAMAVAAPLARNQDRPIELDDGVTTNLVQTQLDAVDSYADNPGYPPASRHVIVVDAESPTLAAPFVAWASFSGAPLLLADDEGLDAEVLTAVRELAPQVAIIGPAVSDDVRDMFADFTSVEDVGSEDEVDNALDVAQLRTATLVGWGFGEEDADGSFHNIYLSHRDEPELSVVAGALAGRGKAGPLLLTGDELPDRVQHFVWSLKPDWIVTPAEGPFNHITLIGNVDQISWDQQSELDWAYEIQNYVTQGPGLSSLDALFLGWIILAFCCGAWVVLNSIFKMPMMLPQMRMMWGLLGVLLGPIGAAIYVYSYHARPAFRTQMGMHFRRNSAEQALVATAMGVAFGASIMIATAFFLFLFGMPLFIIDGWWFWLGSPMVWMLFLMWLVAVLVAIPVFQWPMLLSMGRPALPSLKYATYSVLISMTATSIGMMSVNWMFQMNSPLNKNAAGTFVMMQSEESMLFTAALLIATLVGYLTSYPFNLFLISRGWRPGLG